MVLAVGYVKHNRDFRVKRLYLLFGEVVSNGKYKAIAALIQLFGKACYTTIAISFTLNNLLPVASYLLLKRNTHPFSGYTGAGIENMGTQGRHQNFPTRLWLQHVLQTNTSDFMLLCSGYR